MPRFHYFFVLYLICYAFVGCNPDASITEAPEVALFCEVKSTDEFGIPQSAVYTIIDNQKIKIANIATCDSIPPDSFSSYGIPDSALAAVGGWYAGAGDYLYAILQEQQVVFYQGWQDEMQEDEGFHYTKLGVFANGRFELQLPPDPQELVGTYLNEQADNSHILFVGLHSDTVIGELFVIEGALPPMNQLNILMTGLTPRDSAVLALVDQSYRFVSEMGDGTFIRAEQGFEVSLSLNEGESVTLRKAE